MSPRRRRTGRSRDGLFVWTTEGDVQPDEIADNPLLRPCPFCHAATRQPCRRLSRNHGWIPTATHDSRKTAPQPSSSPVEPQTRPT